MLSCTEVKAEFHLKNSETRLNCDDNCFPLTDLCSLHNKNNWLIIGSIVSECHDTRVLREMFPSPDQLG